MCQPVDKFTYRFYMAGLTWLKVSMQLVQLGHCSVEVCAVALRVKRKVHSS